MSHNNPWVRVMTPHHDTCAQNLISSHYGG